MNEQNFAQKLLVVLVDFLLEHVNHDKLCGQCDDYDRNSLTAPIFLNSFQCIEST